MTAVFFAGVRIQEEVFGFVDLISRPT
jgi:hypothetical protein